MIESHFSIIGDLALLALFLISITAVRYATPSNFVRTRFNMSALFIYIVASLTLSYWDIALRTLPFAFPAFVIGIILGEVVGVRTERQKIFIHGMEHYMERFAKISKDDLAQVTWWTFINFYSISCVLILINLIGFSTVILHKSTLLSIGTSMVGAALIGSILPYLIHLWNIKATTQAINTDSTQQG